PRFRPLAADPTIEGDADRAILGSPEVSHPVVTDAADRRKASPCDLVAKPVPRPGADRAIRQMPREFHPGDRNARLVDPVAFLVLAFEISRATRSIAPHAELAFPIVADAPEDIELGRIGIETRCPVRAAQSRVGMGVERQSAVQPGLNFSG